ncbi:MAG: hypothetical protein KKF44_07930 [Nanoarchaeota archaeon]|nr:hypothetical protein [Nanoarchaeota archaeon]
MKKINLAFLVLLLAMAVIAVKTTLLYLDLQPLTSNTLLSVIITGVTFFLGFFLAGTLSDYKEAERLPSMIASELDFFVNEGRYIKNSKKKFCLKRLMKNIDYIVDALMHDIKSSKSKFAIDRINEMNISIGEAEEMGYPIQQVVRLKSHQHELRKAVMRIYQIKRTKFIPAAYNIAMIMVALTICLLLLLRFDTYVDAMVFTGVVSYIFLYVVLLIKDVDDPFEMEEGSSADVNLRLLDDYKNMK